MRRIVEVDYAAYQGAMVPIHPEDAHGNVLIRVPARFNGKWQINCFMTFVAALAAFMN